MSESDVMPTKGSYLLVLQLDHDLPHLRIGRLGQFDFAAGYYLYVGSAFGAGGLAARLAYHERRSKNRPHWHIDYLRPYARLSEAWTVAGPLRLECTWCALLSTTPDVQIPVRGFGSSDTGCRAHLFYTSVRPCARFLAHILVQALPLDHICVDQLTIDIQLFDEA